MDMLKFDHMDRDDSIKEDFVLHIEWQSRKRIPRSKGRANPFLSLENVEYNKKGRGNKLLFSTYMGSELKIDYLKRSAWARVNQGNPFLLQVHMVLMMIDFLRLLLGMTRVHCAILKKDDSLILLIGPNGSGKSTISRLLTTAAKGYSLLEEDNIFVLSVRKQVYPVLFRDNNMPDLIFRPLFHKGKIQSISHLFFLERKGTSEGSISPISKKTAFNKLLFESDVFFKAGTKSRTENSLRNLMQLTRQCKSYSFINGRDLKGNAQKVHFLFDKVLG